MGQITRHLIGTAIAFCALSVVSSHAVADLQSTPPSAAAGQVQRKERDRLKKEVDDLRHTGQFAEAASMAERLLELEERLHGKIHSDVASALTQLAELRELQGDWDRALARRQEAVTACEQTHGKENWRTADARRAVEYTTTLRGLNADQLQALRAADVTAAQ